MSEPAPEPQPTPHSPFQFRLRTLLLLFVVLGSSLAVFGAWGIVVFGLVVGLAIYLHQAESLSLTVYVVTSVLCLAAVPAFVSLAVHARSRMVCRSGLGHDLRCHRGSLAAIPPGEWLVSSGVYR